MGGIPVTSRQIARVCHEANKAYCESIGDTSQRSWDDAEQWQQDSAISGVSFKLANPRSTAEELHAAWVRDKQADGWVYGPVKDPAKKEHPCIVPYGDLPEEQRVKDSLFAAIVNALR